VERRDSDAADARIWVLNPFLLNAEQGYGFLTPPINSKYYEDLISPAFSERAGESKKIVAAMAAETDWRMFVQQGCFTIHSLELPLDEVSGCDEYLDSLIIPSAVVVKVAEELRMCGFRRGDIFPDLANLSEELISSYPPGSVRPFPRRRKPPGDGTRTSRASAPA
jgi:hypothetical protein